jgi:hypothetical protein
MQVSARVQEFNMATRLVDFEKDIDRMLMDRAGYMSALQNRPDSLRAITHHIDTQPVQTLTSYEELFFVYLFDPKRPLVRVNPILSRISGQIKQLRNNQKLTPADLQNLAISRICEEYRGELQDEFIERALSDFFRTNYRDLPPIIPGKSIPDGDRHKWEAFIRDLMYARIITAEKSWIDETGELRIVDSQHDLTAKEPVPMPSRKKI